MHAPRYLIFAPGAVTKNTDMAVPGNPNIGALRSATVITLSSGAYSSAAATVKKFSTNLGTGEIAVKNKNTLRYGTNTTTADLILLEYYAVEDIAGLKDKYA